MAAVVAGFDAGLLTGAAILAVSAVVVAIVVPIHPVRPTPDGVGRP